MTAAPYQYLSTERAAEFIGDAAGVNRLLSTLKDTLDADLPKLRQRLAEGDTQGVNDLLHQFKGFAPVFCVDSLVERVVSVEHLSKHAESSEIRAAYSQLAPQLEQLRTEVATHLTLHPTA